MSKVSIHIVTWNSMRYLPDALASVYGQTERDFQVIVVDNASTDGVEEFLRMRHPQVVFLRNFKNLGFAKGHDQAIELARSLWTKQGGGDERFVLLTNPDIILTPDYLATLLQAAKTHPDAASYGGMLRKIKEGGDGEFREAVRTDVIDTTGLRADRRLRFVERGAGETDRGQYGTPGEVFGFSGALALYRASALDELEDKHGEIFDERFFAYKEDVDLAWRLRWLGYRAWFDPFALAYHYRGAYGSEKRSLLQAWRERRAKSRIVNALSYRNHLWVQWKNLDAGTFLMYSWALVPYEILKFGYLAIFERGTLAAFGQALAPTAVGEMLRKRKLIMKTRVAKSRDVRKWLRA